MIATTTSDVKDLSASSVRHLLAATNASDSLSQLLNKIIEKDIDAYTRTFSKIELEFVKYLYYYYKKWAGNVQIPIKNICKRFNFKERWVHVILKRLYDNAILLTIKGGFGRKITRRTFSDRGLILIRNIVHSEKISKHDINKNNADYRADCLSTYISTKADQTQKETAHAAEEQKTETKSASEYFAAMKNLVNMRKNE